jgi:surface polysaccharide O-acyltransferase-like enzyme
VIIDVFSHFAVPSFIFISGFVLSHNYNGPFSKKLFYKKRAKSILPQYMIFSIFYIIFDILLSSLNVNVYSVSILKVIFDLLTANSYYHLWFFALIIQFYMFYPYLIEIYNKFVTNNRT